MIEETVLSGLLHNEEYARRVLPFIKPDYFTDPTDRLVFEEIERYVSKYNTLPTKEAIKLAVDENDRLNQDQFDAAVKAVSSLSYDDKTDLEWLVEKTEKFCQDKAIYNAVREAILILDDKHDNLTKGSIPDLLQDALGVSFDTNIGHDYIENAEERFDFYHRVENRIPLDIKMLNVITNGGLARKSLTVLLAGTNVGKTLAMTHFAASNMMHGLNVLYITMEMAEEMISQRIDANLLDISLDAMKEIPKEVFIKKMDRIKKRGVGKIIVKEYPTGSAHAGHFRHLLHELKIKKNFVPDIIYIDYINICASSRFRNAANMNSYSIVKAIAEELRGLGVEFNVPIVTGTQVTRTGFSSTDIDLEDTAESFGLPATADFMVGLISTEDLDKLGQIMVKQLKNRWGDKTKNKRFVIGLDRAKQRLYDVENKAQDDIADSGQDTPVMDNTPFGERLKRESKFNKKRFDDFK